MLWRRQERGRPRRIPGPEVRRLAPTHDPRHVRPQFPCRHRAQSQKGGHQPAEQPAPLENIAAAASGTETPRTIHRRLIAITLAEVRRLLNSTLHHENSVSHALEWSNWRREHQAIARRAHFVRRLRCQTLMI